MAHSGLLGGGIRWKTRKKMRENVSDERGQQNGTLNVLLQDPFEVLGSDLLMAILGYVDSRSVALSLLVSRSWYGIASSDSLWSSKGLKIGADDRVWGGHECCFSTVTTIVGDGKIREHYVRINRWPRMLVSRNEDWSWEMSNHFTSYSSIADAEKDGGTGPL